MTALPRTPSFDLTGRRALVTGSSRGIGRALAAALAQAGARVTVCARTAGTLETVVDAIVAEGGQAEALVLDVTDVERVRDCIGALPAFDILVNNAGTNQPQPFAEVDAAVFDRLVQLNVRSTFFMAQAVARRMIAQGVRGSIVNLSSQAGHIAAAGRSVYTLTKFAVEGMTRAMAVELAPAGIRVNSLCPTFVETDMTRPSLADPAFRNGILSRIPLGRVATVEDLMGAVVFLASDAAAMTTGTGLRVDGGWTAG